MHTKPTAPLPTFYKQLLHTPAHTDIHPTHIHKQTIQTLEARAARRAMTTKLSSLFAASAAAQARCMRPQLPAAPGACPAPPPLPWKPPCERTCSAATIMKVLRPAASTQAYDTDGTEPLFECDRPKLDACLTLTHYKHLILPFVSVTGHSSWCAETRSHQQACHLSKPACALAHCPTEAPRRRRWTVAERSNH